MREVNVILSIRDLEKCILSEEEKELTATNSRVYRFWKQKNCQTWKSTSRLCPKNGGLAEGTR